MSEGATCASMRIRPLTPRQRAHIEEQRCAMRSSMSFSLACERERESWVPRIRRTTRVSRPRGLVARAVSMLLHLFHDLHMRARGVRQGTPSKPLLAGSIDPSAVRNALRPSPRSTHTISRPAVGSWPSFRYRASRPENAETALFVVEGDPLDEAGPDFVRGSPRIGMHLPPISSARAVPRNCLLGFRYKRLSPKKGMRRFGRPPESARGKIGRLAIGRDARRHLGRLPALLERLMS
jgi:hypothetical protein